MRNTWISIEKLEAKKATKNRLFILAMLLKSGLAGAIVWLLVGRILLPNILWLICFMGYPAVFVGFCGAVLYLYNHEFA